MRSRPFALLVLAFLVACSPRPEETTSQQTVPPETPLPRPNLSGDQAGQIVQRAIDHHGGWDAWTNKKTVQFKKTTTRYRPDGTVEYTREQFHRYVLRPELQARIEWEADGKKTVLVNTGGDAWKIVDGQVGTTTEDRNSARNSTFGSHYVFNMPWKLADPGVHLAYAGQETLDDGTLVDKVRVTYDKGTGDAGGLHTWTYYFDAKTGRLTANLLNYDPGKYDWTEYHDDLEAGGLRFARQRLDFEANEKGKAGPRVSEIVYEDIRFDVPLEASLFRPPQIASALDSRRDPGAR